MERTASRRQFIGGLASVGAGLLVGSREAAAQAPGRAAGRIDVHHHFSTPEWTSVLTSRNILAAPWRTWTPQRSIRGNAARLLPQYRT